MSVMSICEVFQLCQLWCMSDFSWFVFVCLLCLPSNPWLFCSFTINNLILICVLIWWKVRTSSYCLWYLTFQIDFWLWRSIFSLCPLLFLWIIFTRFPSDFRWLFLLLFLYFLLKYCRRELILLFRYMFCNLPNIFLDLLS